MKNFNFDPKVVATGLATGTLQALGAGLAGMAGSFVVKCLIDVITTRGQAPAIPVVTPEPANITEQAQPQQQVDTNVSPEMGEVEVEIVEDTGA